MSLGYNAGLPLIFFSVIAEAENRPKSAHRYNVAEQQLIYKSEIERIWKAQFDSLSRKDEPQLTDEEKKDSKKVPQTSVPSVPSAQPFPAYSRSSSMEREREGSVGIADSRSVLRIKRLVGCIIFILLCFVDSSCP